MQVQLGSKKNTLEVFSTQERSAIQLWLENNSQRCIYLYTL